MKREVRRLRFDGWIAGFGTTSGVRVVVGDWAGSPFGPFTDVMVERVDGHRLLLAPTAVVAQFVAATYHFDAVVVTPVRLRRSGGQVDLRAGPLTARISIGRRTALGWALRAVPPGLATRPAWVSAVAPVARLLLPGVRATGSAGSRRQEWYGARDSHRLTAVAGALDGADLGALAAVDPPVRFGFGSVPATPCLVSVITTVETPE